MNKYLLISILVVAVAALGVYLIGTTLAPEHHESEHGTEINITEQGKEVLDLALSSKKNLLNYQEVWENTFDGYVFNQTIGEGDGNAYVSLENVLGKREMVYQNNTRYLCIQYKTYDVCAEVNGTSKFNKRASAMALKLYDNSRIENALEGQEILFKTGAIQIHSVENTSYNGKPCTMVKYTIDYRKIPTQDLGKLGIAPNSPLLTVYKNNSYEKCIDPEGNVLYGKWTYLEGNKTHSSELELLEKTDYSYSLPENRTINETLFEEASLLYSEAATELSSCYLGEDDKEQCILAMAIKYKVPQVCDVLEGTDRAVCRMDIALKIENPELCSVLEQNYSDACYTEFASRFQNSTFCDLVSEENREECLNLSEPNTNNETMNISEGGTEE